MLESTLEPESLVPVADPCANNDPCAELRCPAPRWQPQAVPDGFTCSCSCRLAFVTNASTSRPPLHLHQSWKTTNFDEMDANMVQGMRSWRAINPSLRQDIYDDQQASAFVRRHYPEWATLYFTGLKRAVERADVFRYLVVHRHGGWWADADTIARRPLTHLSGDLIVGREPQSNADGFGVLQYFFGATPRHPFFVDYLLPIVARRIARRRDDRGMSSVLWATGPLAFTAAYKHYVRDRALATGRDTRRAQWHEKVLPTCAFGAWCFDCEANGYRPYVEHRFLGSWKDAFVPGRNWSACAERMGTSQRT